MKKPTRPRRDVDDTDSVSSYFLTGEVAKLSGLPATMIDYLCRHGLLTASATEKTSKGRGVRRRFNFRDVLLARSIQHLLRSNVSVVKLRRALKTLGKILPDTTPDVLRDKCIVIKGQKPYFDEAGKPAVDLTQGQMVFAFMLDADELWERGEKMRRERFEALARRLQAADNFKSERQA